MVNNTVYAFVRHCLLDPEFNRGGIPTKEADYCERLGWDREGPEAAKFYSAMIDLYELNKESNNK